MIRKIVVAGVAGLAVGYVLLVATGRSQEIEGNDQVEDDGEETLADDPATAEDESKLDDLSDLFAPPPTGSAGTVTNVTTNQPCWMTWERDADGTDWVDPATAESYKRYRIPAGYARARRLTTGVHQGVANASYNADTGACGEQDDVGSGEPTFIPDGDNRFEIFLTNCWAIDQWAGAEGAHGYKCALAVREIANCDATDTNGNGTIVDECFYTGYGDPASAADASFCAWDNSPGTTTRMYYWQEGADWYDVAPPEATPWAPPASADCHRPEVHFGLTERPAGRDGRYCYWYQINVYYCDSPTVCPTLLGTEDGCFVVNWGP